MRETIETALVHFGWALIGQQCDCEHGPHFNRLARITDKVCGEMNFDENLDFMDTQTRVRYWLYDKICGLGISIGDSGR